MAAHFSAVALKPLFYLSAELMGFFCKTSQFCVNSRHQLSRLDPTLPRGLFCLLLLLAFFEGGSLLSRSPVSVFPLISFTVAHFLVKPCRGEAAMRVRVPLFLQPNALTSASSY